MTNNDYQMALLLQQQFEHEARIENPTQNLVYIDNKNQLKRSRNNSKSLTDPSWELIDPTPDIHNLFIAFNDKYFWNKLVTVCVDWSKRMTSCAGVCSYQGAGGLCRITLSEPLLKLRPRKDLVETLLHEMIHAYLFVTNNNRDRDGHGPEFHKHMYRINSEAGTNITVYHNFHDEVRLYQQHWWRCNGPCQQRKPYFGMVRRATNRAPGRNDFWWQEHQRSCGGTFIKVKEPEPTAKNKGNKVATPNNDIRKFIPNLKNNNNNAKSNNKCGNNCNCGSTKNNILTIKDLNGTKTKNAVSNSSSTIVINKKPSTNSKAPTSPNKSHLVQTKITSSVVVFPGKGQVLSGSRPKSSSSYESVRNHWLNKFPPVVAIKRPSSSSSSSNSSIIEISPKRVKSSSEIEIDSNRVKCPVCNLICSVAEMNSHLDQCLQDQATPTPMSSSKCPVCDKNIGTLKIEEHIKICIGKVFDSSDDCVFVDANSSPEMISCLVCNKNVVKTELNLHLDECMGDNIFNNSSAECIPEEEIDNNINEEREKKYNCPVCFEEYPISEMSTHLDECLMNDNATCADDSVMNAFLDDSF